MSANKRQEAEVIASLKPKIEKAHKIQDKIEENGSYHLIKNFMPKTAVFVQKGHDVDQVLNDHKEKILNRHVGLKKIQT